MMRSSVSWPTPLQPQASHVVTFDNLRGDHDASNTVYVAVKADLPWPEAIVEAAPAPIDGLDAHAAGRQLADANRPCNADALTIREAPGGDARRIQGSKEPGIGWDLSEIFKMKFKHILGLLSAAAMSVALAGAASAQDKTVKIGAIFPLSGNAASAGVHAKAAIETAVDIINNAHPELGNLPLTKNAGLTGLGGAKVEVVFADNQGSPATGQNQALRLITEEKVVALTGAYQSGITLTASAIAEKYGIPFVNGELVAANLTERGFKWFFRTTPVAADFAKIYLDFLKDMKAGGRQDRQHRAGARQHRIRHLGRQRHHRRCSRRTASPSRQDIAYSANTTDVQSQVLQLKDKKPDVVIMISYTSDAILYAKTMQALDYKPPMMIADNAGYSDPSTSSRRSASMIAGRLQPLVLCDRPSGIADLPDQRDVQEEERRRRSRRYRGAPDAGLLRAGAMRSIAPARPIPPRSRRR